MSIDAGFVADRRLFATMSKSELPSEGKGRFDERVGTADADTVRWRSTEGAETEDMGGGRGEAKEVGVCG